MKNLTREEHQLQYDIKENINEEDLHDILSYLRPEYSLPEDYINFLFKYNGGTFKECVIPETVEGPLIVNQFYSYDKFADISLNTLLEYSEEDLDNGFFPIADDPGGNYYLLNIRQKNNGQVFYWSHDGIFENGSDKILLFDSFTNFINSLKN